MNKITAILDRAQSTLPHEKKRNSGQKGYRRRT